MEGLKSKIVNTTFILLFIILGVAYFLITIPFLIFLLIGLGWLIITGIASFNISWNYHLTSFSFLPNCPDKKVAITFDDGPNPEYTPQILALLRQYQIKATFFCIGTHIEKHPELLKKIVAEGHTIGNHSYSHSGRFSFYKAEKIAAELKQTNTLVKKLTNHEMAFFRPPFGVTNPNIKKALAITRHKSIGWSVRSFDTYIKQKEKILKRITKNLKGGDIILLHDTTQQTVEILKDFIIFLKQQEFEPVTIDKLMNVKSYK